MRKSVMPIAALALVLGLVGVLDPSGPIAARAETTPEPAAAPESSVAPPPPPTVLRGSRPAPQQPAAVCPPGYVLSPGYGCIGASGGDYAEGSPGYYYYSPDYGWGYPFGGYPVIVNGAGRSHRFAGSHGFRGLPGRAGFHGSAGLNGSSGFRGPAGFRGQAKFGGFAAGAGHMASFGRR